MQHDATQCLPLNGTIDAAAVCAAAIDQGLAILSVNHTMSPFSRRTRDVVEYRPMC